MRTYFDTQLHQMKASSDCSAIVPGFFDLTCSFDAAPSGRASDLAQYNRAGRDVHVKVD